MNRVISREMRRQLERDNAKLPTKLVPVPAKDWPVPPPGMTKIPFAVWRSRHFLVQCHQEADGVTRLSIARSVARADGEWEEGISWEDMQDIKRQVGLGDYMAVEVFPADRDVVNVANMRHLWVLREPLNFGWRRP